MKTIFSEKVAGTEGWGAGYYAEGAQGSSGPRVHEGGDRTKVELSLAKAFGLRSADVAGAGLEEYIKGRRILMTKRKEEDVE